MRYTIGAIVSDIEQYNHMRRSFENAGFDESFCQYIIADNIGKNNYCMYSGGNKILNEAVGDYIILAHQDVRINFDTERILACRLEALTKTDPNWAVAGNAGSSEEGSWLVRITDAYGEDQKIGSFPAKVQMIDGNLIIIRKSSLVAFSRDLSGFHYYGWDLCLNADLRGYSCYVIDWHVEHKGAGKVDESFYLCKDNFIKKWTNAFRKRKIGAFSHDIVEI